MINANALRDRAARCRTIAGDYHPDVARPLVEKAQELEREAARIERAGVERRREATPWLFARSAQASFGRARAERPLIQRNAGLAYPLWEPPRI